MNKKGLLTLLLVSLLEIPGTGTAWGGEIIRINQKTIKMLPHGKETDGMAGDWIMKNDRVIAVIADATPDREANQMVSSIQGAVIDFTTLAENNDQLVVYYPQGAKVDIPAADTIIVVQAKGNTVTLQTVRYATKREPFTAETTYSLRDGSPAIEVVTTYRNTSSGDIQVNLSDRLRCDNDLTDFSPAGTGKIAFVYNKWYHSAYGICVSEGNLFRKEAPQKPKLTDVGLDVFYAVSGNADDKPFSLAPGRQTSFRRFLLTGRNTPDLSQEYSSISGYRYLSHKVQVRDTKAKFIDDSFVFAKNDRGELIAAGTTNNEGTLVMFLEKGEYSLNITKPGHDTINRKVIISDNYPESNLILQPLTALKVILSGKEGAKMPVKTEFRGKQGTRDPFLGPFKRHDGVGNMYFSHNREFTVPLPPGTYEVTFSHGPEYDAVIKSFTVSRGEVHVMDIEMKRAFSTKNWIVADLHNHTTGSGDTNAATDSRVIGLAAAGIEFAPGTEHNRISTFSGVIQQLGLQKFIASTAGAEMSGRPGPGDINHQNAFPLRIQPDKRGNGIPVTDKDPYVQMKRLYDYDNGKFKYMQQNHPNIGKLYFDKNQDGIRDEGYGTVPLTDALEINGTVVDFPNILNGERTRSRLLPWLQMLNLGYHIFGVANSDAHVTGHASGSVFTYIYTDHDQPWKINDIEIARQLKSGHVVISNGPFLDVRVNGALPGENINVPDGKVNLDIRVCTANWCPVNTVRVIINGRADSTLTFTREKDQEMFRQAPEAFRQTVSASLPGDAHLIVIAYGKGETVGQVQGSSMRNALPIAMSNPVFVDVDGNGFKANQDLLGYPLPLGRTGRPAPAEEQEE